jgi:suppressor for copper-sensitivity B
MTEMLAKIMNLRRRSQILGSGLSLAILFAAAAFGQNAPPGAKSETAQPKLNLFKDLQRLGGPSDGGGQPLTLAGSFTVEKGSRRGVLTLSAVMDPGWHVYSLTQPKGGPQKSEIKVTEAPQFKRLGEFQPDHPPHVKPPSVFPVPEEEHAGAVIWSAPIELAEGVDPQSLTIDVAYSGQVCAKACIPVFEKIPAQFAGYTEKSATPGEYHPKSNEAELVLKGHIGPSAIVAGETITLVITAVPNPGSHVYAYAPTDPNEIAKPTLIYVPTPPGWRQSAVTASAKPVIKPAEKGLPATRHHEEAVSWTMEITPPRDIPPGEQLITGYVAFQTCTDKSCLPPHAVQFRAPIVVGRKQQLGSVPLEFVSLARDSSPGGPSAVSGVKGYSDVARLIAANAPPPQRSLPVILLFSLLGGFLLNLMPCVWPVLGLKALSFVQQGGQSRTRIFSLNMWFSFGVLSVFLALATLAAFGSLIPYLGQNLSWGEHFGFLGFQVAMTVLVFAFALSFLGVWEIPIPGFSQSSASSKLQHQEGIAGAFFKGIFTTLLATPCSGPFLGTVFGSLLRQPPQVIYLVFASIGLGMTSPYLVIGAFPRLVRWLPKPGPWMETFKQLMGFVLLGTVVYLFTLVDPDYRIATLALVMGTWFACWLIGRVPVYEPAGKQLTAWVGACAAAAAVGVFAFTFLGPRGSEELLPWQPYSPETLAKLQREGKTVMIDFTASWCPTCKVNLAVAVNTPRVKAVVEKNGVVPLLADWSDRGPVIKAKLNELNSNSIPVLAIYPANRPGDVIVLRDLLLESQVVQELERAGPSKTTATAEAQASETARAPQPSG